MFQVKEKKKTLSYCSKHVKELWYAYKGYIIKISSQALTYICFMTYEHYGWIKYINQS